MEQRQDLRNTFTISDFLHSKFQKFSSNIFFYDLAEIISVLDGYKLNYRDIFLMTDSYTDKVIFPTILTETRTSDNEVFCCLFFLLFYQIEVIDDQAFFQFLSILL